MLWYAPTGGRTLADRIHRTVAALDLVAILPLTRETRGFYTRTFVRSMALHAAEVTTVNKKHLADLRTASVRAVSRICDRGRRMHSVDLALNLAITNSDPKYCLIRARGLGLRNWVARSPADMDIFHRVAQVWVLDKKAVSKADPIAMALTVLATLRWVIDAGGTVDDGLGLPFHF